MKKHMVMCAAACALFAQAAQAELSIGVLGGAVEYTSRIHGDALFNFGPGAADYFQYPGDFNRTTGAAGGLVRYLYPVTCDLAFGLEGGYDYIYVNYKHLRADHIVGGAAVSVEDFKMKSTGVGLLNGVIGLQVVPNITFNIFGGPAWLNTQYIDDDFANQVSVKAKSKYQLTADVGAEANWTFDPNWSAGMRFDYLFDTKNRTISLTGSATTPLLVPLTARSHAAIYSFTLRYLVPCF